MSPEPTDVMVQWLQECRGAFSLPLSMALGLEASNDTEAVNAIVEWLLQPREPFALRAAELTLRAFIDFECTVGTSDTHQGMIDGELLGAVDAAIIPAQNRAAINEALGCRPEQRQRALEAAAKWAEMRPTDQSIYEWWMKRNQDWLRCLTQSPND